MGPGGFGWTRRAPGHRRNPADSHGAGEARGLARQLHNGSAAPTKGTVMKASKFIVLVGGILGILAFFLPMVTLHRADYSGSASAFQIIKGLGAASDAVSADQVQAASMTGDVQSAKEGLDAMKGIVMAIFVPAILLAAIGALGVSKKKFGRVAGFFSLALGLVGLGIAVLLRSAAGEDAGVGLSLLLATGLGGVVGGLLALVKPEKPATTSLAPARAMA